MDDDEQKTKSRRNLDQSTYMANSTQRSLFLSSLYLAFFSIFAIVPMAQYPYIFRLSSTPVFCYFVFTDCSKHPKLQR